VNGHDTEFTRLRSASGANAAGGCCRYRRHRQAPLLPSPNRLRQFRPRGAKAAGRCPGKHPPSSTSCVSPGARPQHRRHHAVVEGLARQRARPEYGPSFHTAPGCCLTVLSQPRPSFETIIGLAASAYGDSRWPITFVRAVSYIPHLGQACFGVSGTRVVDKSTRNKSCLLLLD